MNAPFAGVAIAAIALGIAICSTSKTYAQATEIAPSADARTRLELFSNYDLGRAELLKTAGAGCLQADAEYSVAKSGNRRELRRKFELARQLDQCMQRGVGQARSWAAATDTTNYIATNALLETYLATAKKDAAVAKAPVDYTDLTWGLGFGASNSFDDVVETASIVNGVVRVEDDQTLQTRVLLEFHQYFWTGEMNEGQRWGSGPFLALAAGTEETVLGVGVGWMWGMKSADPEASEGFSVGIGVILDDGVKTLGEGFEDNQPPPPGETAVRFEEKSRPAAILFVTRTF